jgi:CrcB protein
LRLAGGIPTLEVKPMSLAMTFWVALGSAIGGVARYLCSGWVARLVGETFPWGTIGVNVLGSFLIGIVAALTGTDGRLLVAPEARQFMMAGILGGFTTFSSFSIQTLALAQDGEWFLAGANILASVALCLAGVWAGHVIAMAVNR